MAQEKDSQRVFFAAQVVAPWPTDFPKGKIIHEENRHVTLAFLGDVKSQAIQDVLIHFPKPKFQIGLVGKFVKCVFLPKKNDPNVVSYEIDWIDEKFSLEKYQKEITSWLQTKNIMMKNGQKDFYSHMTISRGQFVKEEWIENFSPFPFFISGVHLYESLGNSEYKKLSIHSLIHPFEQIHHTADIAYLIRGESIQNLHRNAEIALAFSFPPIVEFLKKERVCSSIEEIVFDLNEHVSEADMKYGCSFKAVSFHGQLEQTKEGFFQWEMIIDV